MLGDSEIFDQISVTIQKHAPSSSCKECTNTSHFDKSGKGPVCLTRVINLCGLVTSKAKTYRALCLLLPQIELVQARVEGALRFSLAADSRV